jgi:uncharacterized protein (TIGR02145 family)
MEKMFFFLLIPYPFIKYILIATVAVISSYIYKKLLKIDEKKEKERKSLNRKIILDNNKSIPNNNNEENVNTEHIVDNFTFNEEIKIINQTWKLKNLDVDKFNNGDFIYEAKSEEEWINAYKNEQPAWCYFDNDEGNGIKYGKLYNYFAISDIRNIAPKGWRVSSVEDWDILINNLGGENEAGEFLKSNSFWDLNNMTRPKSRVYGKFKLQLHNISSIFEALPGGIRREYGNFTSIGKNGHWWGIANGDKNITKYISLGYYNNSVFSNDFNIGVGLSVRCVKE